MILGVLLVLVSCSAPVQVEELSRSSVGLQIKLERIIGWGTVQANDSKACTTGPGPSRKGARVTCYTQELPPGFDFTCYSPADGAIEMVISNNNNYDVVVGNRWAGVNY